MQITDADELLPLPVLDHVQSCTSTNEISFVGLDFQVLKTLLPAPSDALHQSCALSISRPSSHAVATSTVSGTYNLLTKQTMLDERNAKAPNP